MNKTSGQLSLFNDEELQELENSQKLDPRNRKVKILLQIRLHSGGYFR